VQFLDCPRCRARFRTGFIYEHFEACPRCGTSFRESRSDTGARLHQIFGRRAAGDVPDWETITQSQYAGSRIARTWQRAAE
jgi:uncharacterized C2H2 Zn-finger protein